MIRTVLLALVATFAMPLAAHAASPVPPPSERSSNGVTILEQQDGAAPLAHATLVVRAGLDRQSLEQNGLAALTARSMLRTPIDGAPLEEAVAAHGGAVHAIVDPSDVRFTIEAIPSDAPLVFDLVRRAFAQPSFDVASVSAARSSLRSDIARDQQLALQVGLDMLYGSLASDANAGLPALGSPASLAQLGPNDVRQFYTTFYRRGGTFVSAAGRIDALPAGALDALAAALPTGSTSAVNAPLPKLEGTSRQLVAHRDIPAPWLLAQYPAPAVGSKDFGPMLVLSAFMTRTLSEVAQVPDVVTPTATSRAVGALYQFDRAQPNLTLFVNGGIGNPNRAFATALSVASILSATKLQGSIDDFKALAAGNFVNGSNSLASRAWLAVLFAQNGQSPDYVARTLAAISQTTTADLQRVARQYLGNPVIALVLPREQQ